MHVCAGYFLRAKNLHMMHACRALYKKFWGMIEYKVLRHRPLSQPVLKRIGKQQQSSMAIMCIQFVPRYGFFLSGMCGVTVLPKVVAVRVTSAGFVSGERPLLEMLPREGCQRIRKQKRFVGQTFSFFFPHFQACKLLNW